MKFTIFSFESSGLRNFLREIFLGLVILFALVALNAMAMAPTTPGKRGLFEQFETALSQNFAEQLATRMKVDATQFQITFDNLKIKPALPQFENYRVQVMGLGTLGNRRMDGLTHFSVLVESRDSAQKPVEITVSGVIKIVGPVIVSNRNILRGDLISESDISPKIMPWSLLPTTAMGFSMADIVGKSARTQISAGAWVFTDLVDEPAFVKSGDAIELTVLSGPGVIIRSNGIARQSGKMGDSVRVEYTETKKSLVGLVTGKKAVEVRL